MKTQKRIMKMLQHLKQLLRRQKPSLVIPMLVLVLVSAACKKTQDTLAAQVAGRQTVTDWYRSFSANASAKDKQSAETFIKSLDYSQSLEVATGNQRSVLLVKITGEQNAFFGIEKSGNELSFDGIYRSKDPAYIQQVLTTKTLPANSSVTVYGLNKTPVRGWESPASGKLRQNLAAARPGSAPNKASMQSVRMSSGQWDDCQLVYWITWDVQTGQLLSATYLFNTCDNQQTINFIDPGNTPPGPILAASEALTPSEIDEYNNELGIFNQTVNAAAAQDHDEDASFTTSAIPGDLLTKNWSADWICLNGGGSWNLRSYEVGLLRACTLPGHPWAFKRITHQGITFEGSPPTATEITFTQGFGYPSFTEENAAVFNYLAAVMQLKFSVTYKYTNLGNRIAQLVGAAIVPPKTISYEARGAWKLS